MNLKTGRFSLQLSGAFVAVVLLIAGGLIPMAAVAQESSSSAITSNETADLAEMPHGQRVWNISIGTGAALRPTYEGSNAYRVSPVFFGNITYRDMISLGAGGLNIYWHHKAFRIGGGLIGNAGRKDYQVNGLFEQGDARLRGLGDIASALGVRAFATYTLGMVRFQGDVTKLTGSNNNGVFANIGISVPYRLTDRLILAPQLTATWANKSYMQTYFGVTPAQAAHSTFREFNASAGFMHVVVGLNATYLINRHWFVRAGASVDKLTGAASRSPITFSNTNTLVVFIGGYRF